MLKLTRNFARRCNVSFRLAASSLLTAFFRQFAFGLSAFRSVVSSLFDCIHILVSMSTEKLIELVKSHQVLYDMSHADYKNIRIKDKVWSTIANELGHNSGKYDYYHYFVIDFK